MKTNKIYTTLVILLLTTFAHAQDTKSQFNPIEHAVVSQTIAPDARAAGMGDVGAAESGKIPILHQSCRHST